MKNTEVTKLDFWNVVLSITDMIMAIVAITYHML